MKLLILYYSLYGHIDALAKEIKKGAEKAASVDLMRVPETLSLEVIEKMGATNAQNKMKDIPIAKVENLSKYDAIIFGTPTRFGNMCAQMRVFLDQTGALWKKGSLIGKVGAVFTSSATQHGGQESTILSVHTTLLHQGMVIVGLPYSFAGQMENKEISGCSPYGCSTIAGVDGERSLTEAEKNGAIFLGEHVSSIAKKLAQ